MTLSHLKHFLKRFAIVRLLGHWRWSVFHLWTPILLAKFRYRRTLRRVRDAAKTRPLKVIFVVGNSAKWKAQSLYDLMSKDRRFEPYVALTICDIESNLPTLDKVAHIRKLQQFFESRNMRCISALSENGEDVDLTDFNPDIVFYHQPWDVSLCHMPYHVAISALTFYVPYYIASYADVRFDCHTPFHRTVFGFITLNEVWADLYASSLPSLSRTCRFLPLGHTALDEVRLRICSQVDDYVVYAPHWSIPCCGNENVENLSTFLWSGPAMLSFAKNHPNIRWVFKPHPTLEFILRKTHIWDELVINGYWNDWSHLGITCLDGSYYDLFNRARVLITDCDSFLREFGCTGQPIVHLISRDSRLKPAPASKRLLSSFYQVHDLRELALALEEIVVRMQDPKREQRLMCLREEGLADNHAAQNILGYLEDLLGMKKSE